MRAHDLSSRACVASAYSAGRPRTVHRQRACMDDSVHLGVPREHSTIAPSSTRGEGSREWVEAAAMSYRTGRNFPDPHALWERATRFDRGRHSLARCRGRGDKWGPETFPSDRDSRNRAKPGKYAAVSRVPVARAYCDCDDLRPDALEWLRWSTSSGLMAGLRRSLATCV